MQTGREDVQNNKNVQTFLVIVLGHNIFLFVSPMKMFAQNRHVNPIKCVVLHWKVWLN